MFHDIRHEHIAPVKIALLQGAIQEAARGPDKRMAGAISWSPGCSPTSMIAAGAGPSPPTACVASMYKGAALAPRNALGNLRGRAAGSRVIDTRISGPI